MAELIAALDLPETDQILSMAGTLKGIVPWCKVGMEALFWLVRTSSRNFPIWASGSSSI